MTLGLILQMIGICVLASLLYTLIGIAPGTDETAVLAPVTLVLVLSGMEPILILAFFMAAIVSKKITHSIPVAIAGIPGGVMAAPMVEHAMTLKKYGLPDLSIRKMASGSVIGTLIAVPASLFLANLLTPLAPIIVKYTGPIFFAGAIFLAGLSKEKLISLLSILPLAFLIQGLRHLYWGTGVIPEGQVVFISFFLGITIGPMILSIIELAVTSDRKKLTQDNYKKITISSEKEAESTKGIPSPFKILTKKELTTTSIGAALGTLTFFLSPVGMTILLGETLAAKTEDEVEGSSIAIATMDSVTNAAYMAGTLIPLIALGIPLSPMAIGPANPLFNAPPRFSVEHNLHHLLSFGDFTIATVIATVIALGITYTLTIKYSKRICIFVFKKVPHESLLALFFSLVVMLSYMDAGIVGIFGTMLLAIFAGFLNRKGVNYGVQFMVLYSAPWMISILAG